MTEIFFFPERGLLSTGRTDTELLQTAVPPRHRRGSAFACIRLSAGRSGSEPPGRRKQARPCGTADAAAPQPSAGSTSHAAVTQHPRAGFLRSRRREPPGAPLPRARRGRTARPTRAPLGDGAEGPPPPCLARSRPGAGPPAAASRGRPSTVSPSRRPSPRARPSPPPGSDGTHHRRRYRRRSGCYGTAVSRACVAPRTRRGRGAEQEGGRAWRPRSSAAARGPGPEVA